MLTLDTDTYNCISRVCLFRIELVYGDDMEPNINPVKPIEKLMVRPAVSCLGECNKYRGFSSCKHGM